MEKDINEISFEIIAYSGDARSFAFQALNEAKKQNYEKADELLQKAKDADVKAHQAQTDLLFDEMAGKESKVNVLLVHSQDHLMTSMLALELIEEMIELYKKVDQNR
ncbi:PTS lactose/cellobiose transporter subunit IIA [Floccifex sp.]|uniref:PTS lactose/cellobiose transporter subunit IIA n=1 Tax=Floccifex sp. TaxID=2815810 RepID=UPI002A760992|nr:PTS lactose/cellobiose transporter subunit IIA [Floccifex sp.]MDD7281228.1 PTS lactose/cellobiose transporter subunit IIA [Erysipelotrichaceae bacterium]MDY2958234.1 PTS lactose/cellobiose transporter subunit IIA [Floccifex sp.]